MPCMPRSNPRLGRQRRRCCWATDTSGIKFVTIRVYCSRIVKYARANLCYVLMYPFRRSNTRGFSKLVGTVPHHQCYILLHSVQPPSEFPARKSTAIQRELQLKVSKWGGLVNFSWFPMSQSAHGTGNLCTRDDQDPDVCSATSFSVSGRLDIPQVSLLNLDDVDERLRAHVAAGNSRSLGESLEDIHLYVCTHGARDCRCGEMGGRVVRALREELERREKTEPPRSKGHVKVGEVGHVGGHKCVLFKLSHARYCFIFLTNRYAANLLVFPHGDWYVFSEIVL